MTEIIIAIDPGNVQSAYSIIDSATFRPLEFAKVDNERLRQRLLLPSTPRQPAFERVVIERIQSYGMAVGREVFETCEWVGRFTEDAVLTGFPVNYVYRIEEKRWICHNPNANDANIHRALIDRFAGHDLRTGKGTKKNPDFFFGFHADVWASFAVGVTHILKTRYREEEHQNQTEEATP